MATANVKAYENIFLDKVRPLVLSDFFTTTWLSLTTVHLFPFFSWSSFLESWRWMRQDWDGRAEMGRMEPRWWRLMELTSRGPSGTGSLEDSGFTSSRRTTLSWSWTDSRSLYVAIVLPPSSATYACYMPPMDPAMVVAVPVWPL